MIVWWLYRWPQSCSALPQGHRESWEYHNDSHTEDDNDSWPWAPLLASQAPHIHLIITQSLDSAVILRIQIWQWKHKSPLSRRSWDWTKVILMPKLTLLPTAPHCFPAGPNPASQQGCNLYSPPSASNLQHVIWAAQRTCGGHKGRYNPSYCLNSVCLLNE